MESKFIEGETYQFRVSHFDEEGDRKYIYLTDGLRDTYRVEPYDFQSEWGNIRSGDLLHCYVTGLNIHGLPYLVQSKFHILDDLFAKNEQYPFKILSKERDQNTGALFYNMKSPYGIQQRFYVNNQPDPDFEVSDIISFYVKDVIKKERNKSHLQLSYEGVTIPQDVVKEKQAKQQQDDPQQLSQFGAENNELEFKSSIIFPAGDIVADIDTQMQVIVKTITGFQNRDGGKLLIGVNDSGEVTGIEDDFKHLNSSKKDPFYYKQNEQYQ